MGNVLGQWWFPAWLRAVLTNWGARHFTSFSWHTHDASYEAAAQFSGATDLLGSA